MLKLNKYLEYQITHFEPSYIDFIYKVHQVLEHNEVENGFWKETQKVLKKGKDQEILYDIASDLLIFIRFKDRLLADHLDIILSKIEAAIDKNYAFIRMYKNLSNFSKEDIKTRLTQV